MSQPNVFAVQMQIDEYIYVCDELKDEEFLYTD